MSANAMYPLERLNQAVMFIENNLKSSIQLDDISSQTGLTKYHLHRIFKSVTGLPLMEYVRCRRLSSSLVDLVSKGLKVIDVALEWGFESEQAYIRAFRKTFGVTPGRCRRDGSPLPIVEPVDLSQVGAAGAGFVAPPRYIYQPTLTLVGKPYVIDSVEDNRDRVANQVGRSFYENERKHISYTVNSHVYMALVRPNPNKPDSDIYTPCVQVSSLAHVPEGMKGWRLPGRTYAVFRYIGFHHPKELSIKELTGIYSFIYNVWLPQATYSLPDAYHLERIDESECKDDYCVADIYLPVVRR